MPEGLPTAASLIDQKVTFFSIDTDVLKSHGFKFNEGTLHALATQRPHWFHIQLTDVVEREVLAHRMEPVAKAVQEMQSAITKVQRLSEQDLKEIKDAFDALNSESTAKERFIREFHDFARRLGGGVLSLDGSTLAHGMFVRYFEQLPPFEAKKKSEFPDAASLLALEGYAASQGTLGIVVALDGGWANFANESKYLYRVSSVDELVALFESKGEKADRVKEKLRQEMLDPTSNLSHEIDSFLGRHVNDAFWDVSDVYSGFSVRVETEVNQVHYQGSDIHLDGLGLWLIEHDPTVCTVELQVNITVDIDIYVEFFQYDTIDHEELRIGFHDISRREDITAVLYLICTGDLLNDPVSKWDFQFEIEGGDYRVDIGEVNPNYGDDEDDYDRD